MDNLIHQVNETHHKIYCNCGCDNTINIYTDDDFVEIVMSYEDRRNWFQRVWAAITNNRITHRGDIVLEPKQFKQIANLFKKLS